MSFFAGLFGGRKAQSTQQAAAAGINAQTSVAGKPVPLLYGRTRVAPNYIWYGDFIATQQQSSSGGGGKGGVGGGGGGKGGGGSSGYIYNTSFIAAICEGQITGIGTVWVDKNITSLSSLGLTFFNGALGQAAWGYMTTNHPDQALGYNLVSYVAAANYALGSSPQLPNHNFEGYGLLQGTAPNGVDADPSQVINDILTSSTHGVGFPSSRLGSLTTYQAYCLANGLWISPYYDSQTATASMIDDIAKATNSAVVWSSGVLTLVPYGDQNITANGYTYTAPSSPIYSLGDDDFLPNTTNSGSGSGSLTSNDPVQITRKRPSDAYNSVKVEWLDRNNQYQPAIVQATDQGMINIYGLRQDAVRTFHMFCDGNAAQLSAQLQLQREQIRNIYSFTLDQRYIGLDPMDIVAISDSNLGISNQWVRIISITENEDLTLAIVAEEYLAGNGNAPLYTLQQGQGFAANYNAAPGNVNTPVIFEPPDALAGGLEVWCSVSGVNPALWGGCDVYISTTGANYKLAGRINGNCRQGLLTASLGSATAPATGQTIDTTNTLSVSLSESAGTLASGTITDATNLNTLCYVDGELIAYETATLTGANNYNLTTLVRGAYNTTISSHMAGTQFARLDSNTFQFPYDQSLIGTTIYIKFVSFNIYGGAYQSIGSLPAYAYTLQGTAFTSVPPDVTGFATAYVAGLTQLIWNAVSDFRTLDYEIRLGQTWSSGKVIARTPLLHNPILGDGTYWIAAHFQVPNGGQDIYSANPQTLTITGSQITQNVIASYDESATGWGGTFSNTLIMSGFGLTLNGAGNVLTEANVLTDPNILYYGGVVSSGTYQIPAAHRINIGRVAACQVIITMGAEVGYSTNAVNILSLTNVLTATNITGVDLGNNTNATPQIRLSQDGSTWGAWQNWIPGSYQAKAFDCQVILSTQDTAVTAVLTDLTFTVDVPTLTQSGTNLAIATIGTSITYSSVFNGGPGGASVPNLQVTILNAAAGDDVLITSNSLSGFTVQVVNGGSGVARNINYIAQGY